MFSQTLSDQPLLTEKEINKLLLSAATVSSDSENAALIARKSGEILSPDTGAGTDFAEVRAYHSGDDPRHIDWRATARTGKPLLRTFHNERSQPLCILIDRTDTMRYGTQVRLKVTQALRLALWISGREARKNRDISFVILDKPSHWLPEQQGINSIKQMLKQANLPCPPLNYDATSQQQSTVNWNQILSGIKQHILPGSELVLISDFNSLNKNHGKLMCTLGQYCLCHSIHIFDPSETEVNFPAAIELHWHKIVCKLSVYHQQTASKLNAVINTRMDTIMHMFSKAQINFMSLSVTQQDLSSVGRRV